MDPEPRRKDPFMATRPPQPAPESEPRRRFPWWLVGVLVVGLALAVFQFWPGSGGETKSVPLSEVAQEVKNGQVQRIEVSGDSLNVTLKDGTKQTSDREPDASLTDSLARLGVTPEQIAAVELASNPPSGFSWASLLLWLLPLALIFSLFFSMRRGI